MSAPSLGALPPCRPNPDEELVSCAALQPAAVLGRMGGENFPVALRFLPPRTRRALLALYGFARLVDQIGDDAPGDRALLLDALERDLERSFSSQPHHPLLATLAPVIHEHALPRQPFARLIEANRLDLHLRSVDSWDELLDYCRLSANPVGELVLHVFGRATAENVRRSDAVCSALQVLEHCQDVAEDWRRGRVYLPQRDRMAHSCDAAALTQSPAPPVLRRVVELQVARARKLLAQGPELIGRLRGHARLAVSGFVGGGLATCDALEAARFDPNRAAVRPGKLRVARHAVALLAGSGGT